MTPFQPRLIDDQRFPWGIAHEVDGVPHFRTIDGRIDRFATESGAQLAADYLNAERD